MHMDCLYSPCALAGSRKINFAVAGHFERIAADSETLRHLKQFHKPPGLTPKNIQEVAQKASFTCRS